MRHIASESIVFDLDGTLVDSAPGIRRCLRMALAEVAPGEEPEYPARLIGPPVRDMVTMLLPEADETLIDAAVAAFRLLYDGGGWREAVPYAGASDSLAALRSMGHRLFIVTNKPSVPTQSILAELGWNALFDLVVCRDSTDPPFADKAAAVASLIDTEALDADRTVLVGDTLDDALAARANGLAFVFAAYGYDDAAAGASAWVTVGDIASLMQVFSAA
jgi:phosphoglycolate phosphatase